MVSATRPRMLLVATEVSGYGGTGTAGYNLFTRMHADGHDVHLIPAIMPGDAEWTARTFGRDSGNPHGLPNVTACWLQGNIDLPRPELAEAIDAIDPDIMLGLGFTAGLLASRACPDRPMAFLTGSSRQAREYLSLGWARDMISLAEGLARRRTPPPILSRSEAEAVDRSRFVLTHSPQTLEMMRWFFPTQVQKFHPRVLSFAEWIAGAATPWRDRAWPFADRDIDLLFVASDWSRLEKNYPWVRAMARDLREARIHVMGRVPRETPGVVHHGFARDQGTVFGLMARSRCVVSPSISDAAPGVLYEGAALGCNVIASRNCGNWELCHPDLLADPFTPASFVACARRGMARPYENDLATFLDRGSYQAIVEILVAFAQPIASIAP